jgi:hypothetical protein
MILRIEGYFRAFDDTWKGMINRAAAVVVRVAFTHELAKYE